MTLVNYCELLKMYATFSLRFWMLLKRDYHYYCYQIFDALYSYLLIAYWYIFIFNIFCNSIVKYLINIWRCCLILSILSVSFITIIMYHLYIEFRFIFDSITDESKLTKCSRYTNCHNSDTTQPDTRIYPTQTCGISSGCISYVNRIFEDDHDRLFFRLITQPESMLWG